MTERTSADESEWLQRARQGDATAFSRLVEAYQVPVFNLCFRMVGNADLAEEASQEVFLKAFRNLAAYDPHRPFRTWLLSIAAHHSIDSLRRRRLPTVPMDDLPPEATPHDRSPSPEAALLARERADEVEAMLQSLAPQDRAAILLRYWYDMPYEEMAGMLQTSVSGVKSRLHRARRQLAEKASTFAKPRMAGGGRRAHASPI